MNSSTKQTRLRRAKRTRKKINELGKTRLTVHRTPRHIYAQIISAEDNQVLAAASTLGQKATIKGYTGNISAAKEIGTMIAAQAKKKGITTVAFDRSGHRYHGRVKALAEAARSGGLQF